MLANVRCLHSSNTCSTSDPLDQLVRTYTRKHQYVDFREPDIAFSESGTPTYAGLPLDDYLSLLDMLNPMHRLWSDGRWNKLTVAHGCYWKKCSFCDVNLDYISRYDLATTEVLIGRIESLIRETGQTGFHFVDEAAPPKALKSLANALLQRKLDISWWGNIRSRSHSMPAFAGYWPKAAASPSPADWKWHRIACSSS